jgi:hypothetical protein
LSVSWRHGPESDRASACAIDAQGGEQKLRALQNVQFDARGYRNMLEQSERPEGPYITEFDSIFEIHDQAKHRLFHRLGHKVPPVATPDDVQVLSDRIAMRGSGTNRVAGSDLQAAAADESLSLSPERLLFTASSASDLHVEPDVTLQSVKQRVLSFTYLGTPVRIYLNPYTMLPTAVDSSGAAARSGYWSFLGDVRMRIYYGFWWLAKSARLEGFARYVPRCTRLCRSTSPPPNPVSYSCHVTPSTPGEALR